MKLSMLALVLFIIGVMLVPTTSKVNDQRLQRIESRLDAIETTTNIPERIAIRLSSLLSRFESRVRRVEFNDSLDRALRDSLIFTVVSGKVVDVEFDGGKFATEYFESIPGLPPMCRLKIGDMSPKTKFHVKE